MERSGAARRVLIVCALRAADPAPAAPRRHAAWQAPAPGSDGGAPRAAATAFELADLDVTFPNDDTAIVTYRVRQRVAGRGKAGNGGSAGELQEMNDSSTWVRIHGEWKCAMHTETPAGGAH